MCTAGADTPRLLLIDGASGMTRQALQALGVPHTLASPGDYSSRAVSLFDYELVVWGMDNDQAVLSRSSERVQAFVRSGGVFVGLRCGSDMSWLPSPVKLDKAYQLGEVLRPEHPIFCQPTRFTKSDLMAVHGGSIYRAFFDPGPGWVPLVSTGAEQNWDKSEPLSKGPHYGLLELAYGKGRILLCQMIPDYGLINDDKGRPGPSSRFLANLLAYATSVAPDWPAPKPRVLPASFHTNLGDLLRDGGAMGTLRMSDAAWQVTSQGPYTCKTDRRGVMTMSHADCPAAAGSFLQMQRTIAMPSGHVWLRFYNSDDYCGGNDPTMVGDKRVSSRENKLAGVRYKQVLVNGQVVWEEDALGLNAVPASRRFQLVDVSKAAGQSGKMTVTFRVEDRKATAEDQPFATDVYWAGLDILPGVAETPVAEGRTDAQVTFTGAAGSYAVLVRALDEHTGRGALQVTVDGKPLSSAQLSADDYDWYWIDFGQVDLKPGATVSVKATPDAGEACTMQSLALVPAGLLATTQAKAAASTGSPLYEPAQPVAHATFPVLLCGPEAYKPRGEVLSGGVPFAYGAVKSEQNLRLLNDQDREVPLQTRALAKWPDGSLKWVLFTFPTAPGQLRCEYGTQVSRGPVAGLTLTQDEGSISINTGPLQAVVSKTGGQLCESLSLNGKPVKTPATAWPLELKVGDKVYSSAGETVSRCELVEAGPLRAVIRRVGRLRSTDGSTLLEYDLTQQFDAKSTEVRFQPVLTHKESDAEVKLNRVSLSFPVPTEAGAATATWVNTEGKWLQGTEARIDQRDDENATIWIADGSATGRTLPGKRENGFLRRSCGGMTVDFIPRWFWQMAPRSVQADQSGLQVAMVNADSFVLHQGEALWNDFALRFSSDSGAPQTADFEALASPATVLAEPSYLASTLALGEFGPASPAVFPEYEQSVESVYKQYLAKRDKRREYGLENFGDDTFEWGYGPVYTFWSNQEYDHHYGMLLQFARSGDYRWWEIGDQGARHYRDVDCYHWAPGREQLLGAPHHHNAQHFVDQGWVADHTVAGASNGHSWVEGLIAYYFLTGDPRARETYEQMGNWYCWTVENNQYGAGGQERGPGWTLIALSALYNATYDAKYYKAGSQVLDWLRSVQDPVRGVISIPISEQPSYEGGTSFMHGIVARGAGRWYEATGDVRGREAALGIADWLTTEAMGPPAQFYYKQAPRIKGTYSAREWQCLTALSYAAKYGDPRWFGPLVEELYTSGGAATRSIAWAPQSLAHLLPVFTPLRARLLTSSLVLSPTEPGEVRVSVTNTTGEPVTVTTKVLSTPAGISVPPPQPLLLEPGVQKELVARATLKDLAQSAGEVRLEITAGQMTRAYTLPIKAVAKLVRLNLGADQARLKAPFTLLQEKPPCGAVLRDAAFTGNPRQPGEKIGWMEWEVEVPVAGTYYLAADCWWLDEKGNSLFLQVDDGPEATFGNDSDLGRWHVVDAPAPLELTAGTHTLRLINREEGGKIRRLMLTNVQ
ncbi:MAG: hypothetical protein ABFE16_10215 [Armatimonadia bacterium]